MKRIFIGKEVSGSVNIVWKSMWT